MLRDFFMQRKDDKHFREYILNFCDECIREELRKPREELNSDRLSHYVHLKAYVLSKKRATTKMILDYMAKIESNDEVMMHSRKVFKKVIKNLTAEEYSELLSIMDEAIE